jgi:transposase
MSKYRLYPTPSHERGCLRHCADARFVWNLGQEQRSMWRAGRGPTPGYAEQSRQLTQARAAEPWLAEGSHMVQQQALRDLDQAWGKFFAGTNRRPGWRKVGRGEGFGIVGDRGKKWDVRRLNRHWGQVKIPKVGWVRFRWSRPVPTVAKSYRVTRDRSGRWHVAFAVIPEAIPGPHTGVVVGIDRGVTTSVALSNGQMYQVPEPSPRSKRLHRRLSRAKPASNRRKVAKARLARLRARDKDRRKDWVEKASTDIARRFDVIRIEDLKIRNMTRKPKPICDPERAGHFLPNLAHTKAGLNRGILRSGWGLFAKRLEDKAPGRVEKVSSAYTSQRCSACGHVSAENRKSQAVFACTACTFTANADVNAAINIAAGLAVTGRGDLGAAQSAKRQPLASAA